MIDSIKVANFKGFSRLEVPRLSRLTILGGENNIGKTSLLEAIFLYAFRYNNQAIPSTLVWRGLQLVPLTPSSAWFPLFYRYDTRRPVEVWIKKGAREELFTVEFVPQYSPRVQASPFGAPLAAGSVPAIHTKLTVKKDVVFDAHGFFAGPLGYNLQLDRAVNDQQMPVAALLSRGASTPQVDANMLGGLDVTFQAESIVQYLRPLEPRLKELSIIPVEGVSIIHGDIGIGRKVPVNAMGEGLTRLLTIILVIATSRDGCVLVDEIGNGLHYSVVQAVWKSISDASKRFNCQVICTTHSYEFLQSSHAGTPQEDASDFTYTRLERDQAGALSVKTYDHSTLGAALKNGWEVR